jgi:hypothetical protein
MAVHPTYYLKIDRSMLNPREKADWVTSIGKATVFGTEPEAQAVKGQFADASGVIEGEDGLFYVMKVAR